VKIKGVRTSDFAPGKIGSRYRGQQLIVFGHYFGDGIADVRLTGKISGQAKTYSTQVEFPVVDERNPEIERLWAYAAIEDMMEEIHNFGEKADIKQAVTDIALEYGLVTDYTSMIVVREEVFDALGIKRTNKQRLETEHAARQARAGQPAASNRADTNSPMFNQPRANFGNGGGALNIWMLLLLLPVVLLRRFKS